MNGIGPVHVFKTYLENDITYTGSHVYGEERKLTKSIIGYDANSLDLYFSGEVMPCFFRHVCCE